MSPRAVEIFERAKQHILKNWDSYSPELQAQYKIELDRIDRKAPSLEVITLKGMMSFPSMLLVFVYIDWLMSRHS